MTAPFSLYLILFLTDLRTCRHLFLRYHQGKISVCILCTEDHTLAEDSGKLGRLQVCNDHNLFAHHFLCGIMSLDSGYDLTNLASDLNLRAEKLSGFLNLLTGDDLTNLELQLLKIIESDLRLCLDIDH